MSALRYTWFDVFGKEPLTGNQLCVFHEADAVPLDQMRQIARELNHSETTFLQRPSSSEADLRVRILLPTPPLAEEIPFAGHPLLGSAVAAVAHRRESADIRVETGLGVRLMVTVTPTGPDRWMARMEQPLPAVTAIYPSRGDLASALGLEAADLRADVPFEAVDNGMQTTIIPLRSTRALDRARPDMAALRALLGRGGLCTLLFALGGEQASTVTCRVFSPFDLVGEDPATGSANGPLGEYLIRHALVAGPVVRSTQGLALGRPSELTIEVERAAGETTGISVSGQVIRIGSGTFHL